ncbi:MAG TPA: hypothetical protein VN408_20360 [Actinoplanes sp.]|nr:hypothetical protein [Actinoplanes sp.]
MPGHAEPVAGSEFEPATGDQNAPVNLPNIADYWPDDRQARGAYPDPPDFDGPPPRRGKPAAILVGLVAGAIAVGTLLLMRPQDDTTPQDTAAPAAPVVVESAEAGPEPSSGPSREPSREPSPEITSASPPPAALKTARFDLVSGITELNVRTGDTGGENFAVTTPKNSGLKVTAAFTGGTLKVTAKPDGTIKGSGRVDVLLSRDTVWRLRMTAGVEKALFDMGGGTVSDIDLIGGAQSIDIRLGNLDGTLPILMAGGVNKWRIATSEELPVQVDFTSGAGELNLYGQDKGGIGEGLTVKTGDWDKRPGLDIDAEAGLGSLVVTQD